ncbi:hypothetical protein ACIBUY_03760 [Streptomyces sp. NPDC050085]
MDTVTIIPGLTVDRELYDAAVAGLAAHLPEEQLTWQEFTSRYAKAS